jgi:hypothetical protein
VVGGEGVGGDGRDGGGGMGMALSRWVRMCGGVGGGKGEREVGEGERGGR